MNYKIKIAKKIIFKKFQSLVSNFPETRYRKKFQLTKKNNFCFIIRKFYLFYDDLWVKKSM